MLDFSSPSRDWTRTAALEGRFLTTEPPGKSPLLSSLGLLLLLLLLSHFSRDRLCVTPEMAAHQAPPSLGFSRQEHCSGLPFPSPMQESEKWKWSLSVVALSDPVDCSLPGSCDHGICQARVLEWGASAFSVFRFSFFLSFFCYRQDLAVWGQIFCLEFFGFLDFTVQKRNQTPSTQTQRPSVW